ncbi:MAG: alanine racemase [Deltaproteobacteria bacterium RIFCSPLOWO2_12_FULL_44_12]|nr:MAG: alanine racemase [Deltaproteobacteria bacterium RIFCSPHIGHO2_01_FULL_43_49]OGQ16416.1 MAG: alanine racemase [Deltaproteobacteria bacterium RIFCSPHIGHO2_02_FULL_44_53]OGQ27757.1 MAG: alanine racemase [Deltaproteobacteria bacterium RIFCSPHIGHO2_12_FULL_44_21]OGQ32934.1 MAG: alanine racemase [Deltaproteobacteria bacterium RIFCSPLOWO2_01_FULL_45_74]OGQ42036.1 MAG: alanine racemase [Deltaproteobacteria bacterium RIFCSPLOWO2_02_FULL_44_34]OGQ71495.1 MAG: alanine racemase [Deltaproteobacteria
MVNFRPTHAVIDLKALKHNYQEVVKRLPKGVGVLTMVKADAYGHGAVAVAKVFEACGAVCLGVATIEEGIELRQAGVKAKILVMAPPLDLPQNEDMVSERLQGARSSGGVGGLWGEGKEAAEILLKHCLTPVVHSAGVIELLGEQAKVQKADVIVHLKIDTGMNRLGVTPQALPKVLKGLAKVPQVKLEGVMTHLAWRQNKENTDKQVKLFKEAGAKILATLGKIPVWHIANSASVMEGSPIEFDWASKYWVRPGIMLYGIPPYPEFSKKADLKPVMSLKSKVALMKQVPKGTKVSYNCTFTTKRSSCIGVVPIGYADGYPWSVAGKASVLVEDKRVPVLGRVTMDMIMVDLTDSPKAKVGSEVVLLGKQGAEQISADEIAKWAGTIGYEIVCRVSKRMPRVYYRG